MSIRCEQVREFLEHERIAVAGVSHTRPQMPANAIYRKLRDAGYQVYPVNPAVESVEGARCYPSLAAIDTALDGVVISTRPEDAMSLAAECVARGVPRVWFHRSFGPGSYSPKAAQSCRDAGLGVIEGGCPMMFVEPVDPAHKCVRGILRLQGRLRGDETARWRVAIWSVAWILLGLAAVLNGALRELTYARWIDPFWAHQIAVFPALALFALITLWLARRWPLASRREALLIGAIWFGLTNLFELGVTALRSGWAAALALFDLGAGNLWLLLVVGLALLPILATGSGRRRAG